MSEVEHVEQAKALATIGQMTRTATHDLNNQMAAILTFADLVLEALPVDHPIRCDIEEIRSAGACAAETTRKLGTLARELVKLSASA